MAEDDASDIAEVLSYFFEPFFDPPDAADHPPINQVNIVSIYDEVVLNQEAAKLDDFPHKMTLPFFLRKTNDGCFLTCDRCASISSSPYE